MEERVAAVKEMLEADKGKREQLRQANPGGSVWRSASTATAINGYSQLVLARHRQKQPNLPPTTLILQDNDSNRNQVQNKG
jgi:anti-sigma-K factor RskA